ncbi:MAG: glycosyltransferase family 4 protein [Patescibacteria group bacterium]
MRVTHLINLSETAGRNPFSGAERHLFLLMQEQKRHGCAVEFAPLVFCSGPILEQKFRELQERGITVTPIHAGSPDFRRLRIPLLILRMLLFFRARRHDIIHTHLDIADFAARIAAYGAGCRYIINTFHNDEPHYRRLLWRWQLRFTGGLTRCSIVISDHIRQYLIDAVGLPEANIHTIPYGIAVPETTLSRTSTRQLLNIPNGVFVVGFVGRLEQQKQPLFFLRAVAGMPDIHAVIIGEGSMLSQLIRETRNLPQGKIIIAGYRADAADLMPAFDLFCLPSRWEGLGYVLLEAMARNVPVLGSTSGAIPEILDNGKYGFLFATGNTEDLRAQIQKIKNNPEIAVPKTQAAQRRVREHFSIDTMTEQTIATYQHMYQHPSSITPHAE